MANTHLPEEILIEIFSRLPSKSVGRFRCLSKSWHRNLSTSQFVKSHLSRQTDPKHATLLLLRPNSLQTLRTPIDDELNDTLVPRNLDFPPDMVFSEVVGSCNGLVLLLGKEEEKSLRLFVVNPLTLQHQTIESTLDKDPRYKYRINHGFGYDSCSDDYKIVKLSQTRNNSIVYDDSSRQIFVDVYSLRKGVWKRLNTYYFHDNGIYVGRRSGVFFNGGAINWVCIGCDKYVIAALDLATESFHGFLVGRRLALDPYGIYRAIVIGDCLAVVDTEQHWHGDYEDIWIMKEYGSVNSWTKSELYHCSGQILCGCPFSFIGENELVVSTDVGSLSVWNVTQRTSKEFHVGGDTEHILDMGTFVESLVSPTQYDVASSIRVRL